MSDSSRCALPEMTIPSFSNLPESSAILSLATYRPMRIRMQEVRLRMLSSSIPENSSTTILPPYVPSILTLLPYIWNYITKLWDLQQQNKKSML